MMMKIYSYYWKKAMILKIKKEKMVLKKET